MDFGAIGADRLDNDMNYLKNDFAGDEGGTSIGYLNKNYSHLESADEIILESKRRGDGLVPFFKWLKDEGILN